MDLVKRANQLLAAKKFVELDLVIDKLRTKNPRLPRLCLRRAILGDVKELEKCFDQYLDRFDKVQFESTDRGITEARPRKIRGGIDHR